MVHHWNVHTDNFLWAHDRYKTGENVWVSVNIFYDFLVDLAIKKLIEGKFVCNLGPFRIKISTHSLLTILTHRCVLIIQTLPPTRELKIEKGQKKECRMVNLRLCKTTRPRFQTLRPRDAKSPPKKDFETNTSEISWSGQNLKNHSIPLKEVWLLQYMRHLKYFVAPSVITYFNT